MKMDIFCAGVTQGVEPAQLSGCGVVFIFSDGDMAKYRAFGYALGGAPHDTVPLHCIILALSSITARHRQYKTTLLVVTGRTDVQELLRSNTAAAKNANGRLQRYPNLSLSFVDPDQVQSEHARLAMVLAERAMLKQEHYDSGTVDDASVLSRYGH